MKRKNVWLLAAGLTGLISQGSLVRHYTFDINFNDSSTTAAHGSLVDVGTIGNSGITSAPGEFVVGSGALNLSADRDYVDIPSQTFGSGLAYTIAFWARKAPGDTGQAAQWDMVIGRRDTTSFFIALNDGGTPPNDRTGLRWRSSDSSATRQSNFVAPVDFLWHHHAIVSDGTDMSYYLDGSMVSTDTGKLTGFIYDTIGEAYASTSDFDFHGQIDDLFVYDEALDQAGVRVLVSRMIPEPGSAILLGLGLVAVYRVHRKK